LQHLPFRVALTRLSQSYRRSVLLISSPPAARPLEGQKAPRRTLRNADVAWTFTSTLLDHSNSGSHWSKRSQGNMFAAGHTPLMRRQEIPLASMLLKTVGAPFAIRASDHSPQEILPRDVDSVSSTRCDTVASTRRRGCIFDARLLKASRRRNATPLGSQEGLPQTAPNTRLHHLNSTGRGCFFLAPKKEKIAARRKITLWGKIKKASRRLCYA
jgi:hypothetical protein